MSLTVRYENSKWYGSLTYSKSIVISKLKTDGIVLKTDEIMGIDLGLKDAITMSDGFKSGKILLKELDDKVLRLNQILSCRIEDGENWFKTKSKLKSIYSKKKNITNDTMHKITTEIVN
ncbi:MAG: transposase [Methanobrevibacter sp.]|nr:transposase [Candidatus Methanovirga basalitermitum]